MGKKTLEDFDIEISDTHIRSEGFSIDRNAVTGICVESKTYWPGYMGGISFVLLGYLGALKGNVTYAPVVIGFLILMWAWVSPLSIVVIKSTGGDIQACEVFGIFGSQEKSAHDLKKLLEDSLS